MAHAHSDLADSNPEQSKTAPSPDNRDAPVYRSHPTPTDTPRAILYPLIDSIFAGIGLALTAVYGVALVAWGWHANWKGILTLVVFWLALTYLFLPRLHHLFTSLYIPDYFLARTKTGDGLLGDPVNLAAIGSEADIHGAMQRAGWTKADPITLRSSWGIVKSSVLGRSYPAAPVSNLYLFGRRHDFAYQQEVAGSASQRHHIRFWHTPPGWVLPGGKQTQWLAAGTYDKSVGLSTMTWQITHKIDADIDAERDYVIDTVRYQDPHCQVEVVENFSTPFHDRNGGGDPVRTDGNLPILDYRGAYQRALAAGIEVTLDEDVPGVTTPANADQVASTGTPTRAVEAIDRELPAPPLQLVGGLISLQWLIYLGVLLEAIINHSGGIAHLTGLEGADFFSGLILLSIETTLYVLTLRRLKWARLLLLTIATMKAVTALGFLWTAPDYDYWHLLRTGLAVLVVLALTAPAVREWVDHVRRRGDING